MPGIARLSTSPVRLWSTPSAEHRCRVYSRMTSPRIVKTKCIMCFIVSSRPCPHGGVMPKPRPWTQPFNFWKRWFKQSGLRSVLSVRLQSNRIGQFGANCQLRKAFYCAVVVKWFQCHFVARPRRVYTTVISVRRSLFYVRNPLCTGPVEKTKWKIW
jgi:hypothetical protein